VDHSSNGSGIKNDATATTRAKQDESSNSKGMPWKGSSMGAEWDDRVGPGAAASSIVGRIVLCGWKISSEEVHHPNASYQPAICAAVLKKRIPHHDNLVVTRWYGRAHGRERWRVLKYRLNQARATLLILDALDVIGRAGEAARLSGVEFGQSFPGIRESASCTISQMSLVMHGFFVLVSNLMNGEQREDVSISSIKDTIDLVKVYLSLYKMVENVLDSNANESWTTKSNMMGH